MSVILPTYNMERYVVESVESILNQTFQDLELIIINDGSTDQTEEVLRPYLSHPKIIYRVQHNRGVAAALNHGVQISRGKYIAIQNADDVSLPTRLEEQADVLERNPDVEMVYCQALFLPGDGLPPRIRKGLPGNLSRENAFYKLYERENSIHYAVMFRRRHLAGRDPYPERYLISCDLIHHLRVAHEYHIQGIERPLIRMRRGETHGCLTRDHRRTFSEIRQVLTEIYDEFRSRPPKVTKQCYVRAMSHQYLAEARFYLKRHRYGIAARRILNSLSYRPLNLKAARMVLKLAVRFFIPKVD